MCLEIRDVAAALVVCDRILERPLPYGWLVYDLSFWMIAPWATIAAYYGSYWDMLGALCISPFTIVTYRVCRLLKIAHLEVFLVPLVVGIVTPLIWRYVSNAEQDICHVVPQIFGCLLIYLPGAELVWGAMEIFQGSVVHGASRLVKGLLSAISLATFLVLGWQLFGRNFAVGWLFTTDSNGELLSLDSQKGAISSLPDSNWCAIPPPYSALPEGSPGYPSYLSWPLVVGVYNIPLNLLCLMNVYIPLRSFLGPFIVGQVGLLTLAFFQFQCTPDTCELPGVIQQVLAAFCATWVAMLVEIVQGLPSAISIIPVLFIFAPGSSAVLSVIGVMHRDVGDDAGSNEDSWTSLSMNAFSYGIGIYLGQEVWYDVMLARYRKRKLNAQKKDIHTPSNRTRSSLSAVGSEGSSAISDNDDWERDREFHSPQNIHGHGHVIRIKHNNTSDTVTENIAGGENPQSNSTIEKRNNHLSTNDVELVAAHD
mmetsp:Transcript_22216/g.52264  ORF Transcript_22216/g.52264 Transcript_22216/m.52264 type:complete len:481 (-) Transcript_22216:1243-2685(-)